MKKQPTYYILLALYILAASAVLGGGLLWYGYFVQHPFEFLGRQTAQPVPQEQIAELENIADELVMASGQGFSSDKIAEGALQAVPQTVFVDYRTADGTFTQIDQNIRSTSGEYSLENVTNVTKSYYKPSAKESGAVKVEVAGNRSVEFSLIDAHDSEAKSTGNTVTYPNIYDGIDARYTVGNAQLLEELIVQKKQDIPSLAQTVTLNGMYYKLQDDGSIRLYDVKTHRWVLTVASPVMYELTDKNTQSTGLHYEVRQEGDSYTFTKVFDQSGTDWLASASYPVAIDLSIGITPPSLWVYDVNSYGYMTSALGNLMGHILDNSTVEDGWFIQRSVDGVTWTDWTTNVCQIPTGVAGGNCNFGDYECPGSGTYMPTKATTGGYCIWYDRSVNPNTKYYYRAISYGKAWFGNTATDGYMQDAAVSWPQVMAQSTDYLFVGGYTSSGEPRDGIVRQFYKSTGQLKDTVTISGTRYVSSLAVAGTDLFIGAESDDDRPMLEKRPIENLSGVATWSQTYTIDNCSSVPTVLTPSQTKSISVDSQWVWAGGYAPAGSGSYWLLLKASRETGLLDSGYHTVTPAGWHCYGYVLGWDRNGYGSGGITYDVWVDEAADLVYQSGSAYASNSYKITARDRDCGYPDRPVGDPLGQCGIVDRYPALHAEASGGTPFAMAVDKTNNYLFLVGRTGTSPNFTGWLTRFMLNDLDNASNPLETRTDTAAWGTSGWRDVSYRDNSLLVTGQITTSSPYTWIVQRRSSTNFQAWSWLANTYQNYGPMENELDSLYAYTLGYAGGGYAVIEKRQWASGTLGNYTCAPPNTGPPGYAWPNCVDPALDASGVMSHTSLPARASVTPTVGLNPTTWYKFDVSAVPGTSAPKQNPASTELCVSMETLGPDPDTWPNVPNDRYYASSPTAFTYVTTADNDTSSWGDRMYSPSPTLRPPYSQYGPSCKPASTWATNVPFSIMQYIGTSSGALYRIYPDRRYTFGLYARHDEANWLVPPSTTVQLFSRSRVPSAPTYDPASLQPTSIKLYMNTTASDADPGSTGQNPAWTYYAIRDQTTNRYVNISTGQLNATPGDQTGAFVRYTTPYTPNWNGASGVTVTGLSDGTCFTFAAQSKNGDGVLSISDSPVLSICTPLAPPPTPSVNCSSNGSTYSCIATTADTRTGLYYRWQSRSCPIGDCGTTSWVDWASGSYLLNQKTITLTSMACHASTTRVEVRVLVSRVSTGSGQSNWTITTSPVRTDGWDNLPPCPPGQPAATSKTTTEITWNWTAPTGGETVSTYTFNDQIIGRTVINSGVPYLENFLTTNSIHYPRVRGCDAYSRCGVWSVYAANTWTYAANPSFTVSCAFIGCSLVFTSHNNNRSTIGAEPDANDQYRPDYQYRRINGGVAMYWDYLLDDWNILERFTSWTASNNFLPTKTTLTDTGVACGTQYDYSMRARNDQTPLMDTNAFTTTVTGITPPCAPVITASAVTYNSITWHVVPGTGIAPFSYNLYDNLTGTDPARITAASYANPYENIQSFPGGLSEANKPHDESVRGLNAEGNPGQFAAITAFTAANAPSISAVTCSYASGSYRCVETVNSNSNPSGTEYQLQRRYCNSIGANCTSWTTDGSLVWGTSTSRTDAGLSTAQACTNNRYQMQYQVQARNHDGVVTVWSSTVTQTLPPCPPLILGHTPQTTTSLNWTWQANPNGAPVSSNLSYKKFQYTLSNVPGGSGCSTGTFDIDSTAAVQTTSQVNTQCNLSVTGRDSNNQLGQPASSSAYTSNQSVDNITFTSEVRTDRLILQTSNVLSNIVGIPASANAGLWFRETTGTGWTSARLTSNSATHTPLNANTKYCYQGETRNGDNESTGWLPASPACQYTDAATPKAPRLIRQTSETLVNIIINNTDGNPQGTPPSPDTEYALCVTKYGPTGEPLYSHYFNPVSGQLDHNCNLPEWDTAAECLFNGGAWNFGLDVFDCNTDDGSGYWANRVSFGADTGKLVDLATAGKYDFKLKARAGYSIENGANCVDGAELSDGRCKETSFGSQATLFLVKNNLVGWAWSSKVGWISMNCLNRYNEPDYSCNKAGDWGVNTWFEESRDVNPLEGYAWSSSGQALHDMFKMSNVNKDVGSLSAFKAMAFDNTDFWTARQENPATLYRINPSTLNVTDEYSTIGDGIMRLIYDGQDLWATSATQKKLYRISTTDGTIRESVDLTTNGRCTGGTNNGARCYVNSDCDSNVCTIQSAFGQAGLVFDGTDFWVATDSPANSVIRVRRSNVLGATKQINCNGTDPGTSIPTACAVGSAPQQTYFDGRYIWVNNFNGGPHLSRVDRATGQTTSYTLPAGGAWPRGIVFDGTYWWVSYNQVTPLQGKISLLDKDGNWVQTIDLPGATNYVGMVAFDGTYMWVGGKDNNTIYQIRASTREVVGVYTDNNIPFTALAAAGAVWFGNHDVSGAYDDDMITKLQSSSAATDIGIGWLSFNKNVCSNNYQKGCSTVQANSPECGGSADCVASAGPPPAGPTYGFCYTNTTSTGVKYGVCDDNNQLCNDGNLSLCADPLNSTCIWETCENPPGNTCSDYGADAEVCRDTATANFNGTTREIEGWGRILSQAQAGSSQGFTDWGWLKMSGTYDDSRGNTGTFTTTGTDVDSQEFFGDPDVNPNDLKLFSMFGWGWQAQTSDYNGTSSWLPMVNVSSNQDVLRDKYTDKVKLQIDSLGNQHIAWIGYDDATVKYQVYYIKHVNGVWQTASGAAYTGNNTVANARVTDSADSDPASPPDGVMMFSFVLDSNAVPHFAWQDGGIDNYREEGAVNYTTWDGNGWVSTQIDGTDAQTPTIAVDSGNQPHIVYRKGGYGMATILYRKWNGSAWVSVTNDANNLGVSGAGLSANWPHFVLRSDIPIVAWSEEENATLRNIHLREWSGTAWTDIDPGDGNATDDEIVNTGITLPDAQGSFPLVALYPDGHPGVLWRDGGDDGTHLYFRQWNGTNWLSVTNDANNLRVDLNRLVHTYGRHYDLAIDPSGRPMVIFSSEDTPVADEQVNVFFTMWDTANNRWGTIARTNPTGLSDLLYNISLSTVPWSENPVLALDRLGNPHVLWTEGSLDLSGPACTTNADCQARGYQQCLAIHEVGGMRCSNIDVMYSRWTPGIVESGVGWVSFMPAGALLGIPWVQTMFANIHASQNISLAPPPRGTGEYTSTYLIESGGTISGIPGYYGGTATGLPTSQLPDQPGFSPLIQNQPSVQTLGRDLLDKLDVDALVTAVNSKNYANATVIERVGASGTTVDISASDAFVPDAANPVLDNKVYYFHGAKTYQINSPMMFMLGDSPVTRGNGTIVIDGDLEINASIYYQKWCSNNHSASCTTDTECGVGNTCQDPALTNLIDLPSAAIIVRGNVYISPLISKVSSVVVTLDNPATTTVLEGILSTGRKAPSTSLVDANDDDTYVAYDGSVYTNTSGNASVFGKPVAGMTDRSFMRFPLTDVPAGAEIKDAYLQLRGDGTGNGDFNARIYLLGGNDASSVDFTAGSSLYGASTSNSVNYQITNSSWDVSGLNVSPNLKALVQRFVNQDNYTAGNYIGLSIQEGDAEDGEWRGYQTIESGNAPQLVVEYSPRRTLYAPANGSDDVQAWSSGSDSTTTSQRFGWNAVSARAERSFLRLGPVAGHTALPAEAEILKARLAVTRDTANADAVDFQARQGFLSATNANGDFDAFSGNPYDLPLDLNVSEVAETISGAWTSAGIYRFSDVSRMIQSWVDGSQYTPGYYFGLRLRRGDSEETASADASRSMKSVEGAGITQLEIDYQIPLSVSGLFVAEAGYNFDRKYTKNLAPAEQILYDGRVVANTPPGLADFTQALPVYHRVTP